MDSPFVFFVGDLDSAGRRERVDAVVDWSVDASSIAGPFTADLRLDGHQGGVLVSGVVTADFVHTCNRCLAEFTQAVGVDVSQDFVVADGSEYMVVADHIDTEPLLRDELLLAIPLVPLCRIDCRGLCPECGTDLNTGTCPGHETETVSPFAGLRSLFDQE
jgi:uncharacterized protein